MQDQDLIAEFLAKRGATVCQAGARTTTEHQMKIACGYEPTKTYVYRVHLTGEDGMEFTIRQSGRSAADAKYLTECNYPEARIEMIERI
ncbi:hypothetical protein RCDURKIN_138 [Rhodobacter phage RcDurkin]|nr:hypothetical protein RCDURKIN_138 [Rhodobacter phage RcDurkin]